jgi:hypothetical protein
VGHEVEENLSLRYPAASLGYKPSASLFYVQTVTHKPIRHGCTSTQRPTM